VRPNPTRCAARECCRKSKGDIVVTLCSYFCWWPISWIKFPSTSVNWGKSPLVPSLSRGLPHDAIAFCPSHLHREAEQTRTQWGEFPKNVHKQSNSLCLSEVQLFQVEKEGRGRDSLKQSGVCLAMRLPVRRLVLGREGCSVRSAIFIYCAQRQIDRLINTDSLDFVHQNVGKPNETD
jgi:hypothetical protein